MIQTSLVVQAALWGPYFPDDGTPLKDSANSFYITPGAEHFRSGGDPVYFKCVNVNLNKFSLGLQNREPGSLVHLILTQKRCMVG